MEQNSESHLTNNYRYERKFMINMLDRHSVENILFMIPVVFHEVFHERYINNIYFDYLGLNNFMDNIVGNIHRKKYRIRWYGEMFSQIDKPILELKLKEGLIGDKKSFQLPTFGLYQGINSDSINNVINKSEIPSKIKFILKDQHPVLLNRYKRKYYQSIDEKIRITIDDNQEFFKFERFNNTFITKIKDSSRVILEIKYEKEYDRMISQISNQFPFRLTKSSKYARGMELLYF